MLAPPSPVPPLEPDNRPALDRAEAFELIADIASTEGLPMEWMLAYREAQSERDA